MSSRRFLLVVPIFLTLCACGSDGGTAPELPASIAFVFAPDSLFALSDTVSLTAEVRSKAGSVLPGEPISFTSSVEAVAVVTPAGRLVSRGPGSARITATSETLQVSTDVVVRQKLAAVKIESPTLRLGTGRIMSLTATPTDSRGNAIAGLPTPVFSAPDGAIAHVAPGGSVTGVAVGNARIIARVTSPTEGIREATLEIAVVPLAASPTVGMGASSFSPTVLDVAPGASIRFVNSSGVVHDVDFAGALEKIAAHTAGESSRSFPAPGVFPFHCNLHAGMTGTVYVSP